MGQPHDHDDVPLTLVANLREPIHAPDDNAVTPKMAHDSMVTVRLSEPPALTLDTIAGPSAHESASLIGGELIPLDEPKIGGELIPFNSILAPAPIPAAAVPPVVDDTSKSERIRISNDYFSDTADEKLAHAEDEYTPESTPESEVIGDDSVTEVAEHVTSKTLQDELGDSQGQDEEQNEEEDEKQDKEQGEEENEEQDEELTDGQVTPTSNQMDVHSEEAQEEVQESEQSQTDADADAQDANVSPPWHRVWIFREPNFNHRQPRSC
jgi:hypothetical protein